MILAPGFLHLCGVTICGVVCPDVLPIAASHVCHEVHVSLASFVVASITASGLGPSPSCIARQRSFHISHANASPFSRFFLPCYPPVSSISHRIPIPLNHTPVTHEHFTIACSTVSSLSQNGKLCEICIPLLTSSFFYWWGSLCGSPYEVFYFWNGLVTPYMFPLPFVRVLLVTLVSSRVVVG